MSTILVSSAILVRARSIAIVHSLLASQRLSYSIPPASSSAINITRFITSIRSIWKLNSSGSPLKSYDQNRRGTYIDVVCSGYNMSESMIGVYPTPVHVLLAAWSA
jgi:hypothetical protein